MKSGNTFSIKEARNKFLLVAALLFASLLAGAYISVLLLIAISLQVVLFRLASPSILAVIPACLAYPCLLILLHDAVLPAIFFLFVLLGYLLLRAQRSHFSKNAWLGMISVFLGVALLLVLVYAVYLFKGTFSIATVKGVVLELKAMLLSFVREQALGTIAMTGSELEAYVSLFSESFDLLLLMSPAIFCIFSCLCAAFVSFFFRFVCRKMSVPDGLPERGFHVTLNVPYAIFYIILFVVGIFLGSESSIGIAAMNLRVLFSFIIACIGLYAIASRLSLIFPRISPTTASVLLGIVIFLSPYGSLVWSVIAMVYAVKTIISSFKNRKTTI